MAGSVPQAEFKSQKDIIPPPFCTEDKEPRTITSAAHASSSEDSSKQDKRALAKHGTSVYQRKSFVCFGALGRQEMLPQVLATRPGGRQYFRVVPRFGSSCCYPI